MSKTVEKIMPGGTTDHNSSIYQGTEVPAPRNFGSRKSSAYSGSVPQRPPHPGAAIDPGNPAVKRDDSPGVQG
ncbi:MAG: hypothetical protein ACXAEL_14060, partial [Candidatus Hodarchaeales archaeon]